MKTILSSAFLLALLTACNDANQSGQSATVQQSGVRLGLWRAVATVPGGDLPFHFEISGTVDAPVAHLINGAERVAVRNVSLSEKSLTLDLPSFNSRVELTEENGVLSGTLRLTKRGGVEQVMPLRATYAQGFKHSIVPEGGPDFTGRWDVTFKEEDGTTSRAIGEFTQDGSSITGTFRTPTGDYRYLAGEVAGSVFYLSCFDGAHAFLFKAVLDDKGEIAGHFWSGTKWYETWTAVRDEQAVLPDPGSLTQLASGQESIAFTFPDVGGTEVSFPGDRFKGKVTVITIAGSWCPNCHDEAAFFSPFFDHYHHLGLEAVGLMYEHYREFDKAARQVSHFQERHNIQFPLLVAGYSDKNEAAASLPMLSDLKSFPTMIVVDRVGKVRRIHTGFSGPGTGEHYEAFVAEFTAFIEGLLAEEG